MERSPVALHPFENFEIASRAVLDFLAHRLGFSLWMMTRTEGPEWIVLQVVDQSYNIEEGSSFPWVDSFCSRMVAGLGPHIAPCAQELPIYAQAPIGLKVPIGAYIGVPVTREDGSLFGTLCAIDPNVQDDSIRAELPLIQLLAHLVSAILAADIRAIEQQRLLERYEYESMTDELTGLYNRRAWEKAIALEEARARRYGIPICVLSVDLDNLKLINDKEGHRAGDALLQRTAKSLLGAVRENDLVTRMGGDEFNVLAVECDLAGAEALQQRIRQTLDSEGIQASIGKAMRRSSAGITEAIGEADQAMYAEKERRRAARRQEPRR